MSQHDYWSALRNARLTRRRALTAGAATAAGAALLAACGSSGGGSKSSAPASSLITKPADAIKQAKKGGAYLSSRSSDIDNSDPHFTTQGAPGTAQTYSRLFRRKPGYLGPQPVEFIGDLAESWEFSPDKTLLTVKLRQNAHWHNIAPVNGRPVDPQDIVYTWNRVASVGANRSLLANSVSPSAPIQSVTAIDNQTISIKTAFPAAGLIALLSGNISGYLWMLPRESMDKYDPRKQAIGSGPWLVSNYVPSASITFKRHDGWHAADTMYIDELRQPIVTEYATAMAQFKTGAIYGSAGVAGFIPHAADFIPLKNEVPALELYLLDPPSQSEFAFFGWNPSYGAGTAFRDKRLRQAFSMSIDRDLWIDTFYEVSKFKAQGIPMQTAWNSALTAVWPGWWIDPKGNDLGPDAKNYHFDLATAKQLVSAAGFANGVEMKAQYPLTGYAGDFVNHAQTVINFAAAAGIKLTTAPVNFTTDWRPKVAEAKGDFEGISFRPDAAASLPDPVEFMFSLFHYQGGVNYTGFFSDDSSFQKGDPRLNDLLSGARGEFDDKKRIAAIQQLQKIVADQMYLVRMPGSANSFDLSWPVVRNEQTYQGDLVLVNQYLDPDKPPLKQG